MDVALDAPQLTTVAHGTVREDTLAVADDARILHEVETRPLVLQIILRDPARSLGVQRRLERGNDLGHRGGIPWHGRNDSDASHVVVTVRPACRSEGGYRRAGKRSAYQSSQRRSGASAV